jgi:hypothetical protein
MPDQSFDAAGADGVGESSVGWATGGGAGAGAGCGCLAAGFFAADAAGAGDCEDAGLGRAAGAAAVAGAGFSRATGSGDMMLTGGIEFEDGKSALVGLPVGSEGG